MSEVCSTRSIFRLKAQFFKMGRRIKSQCKYGGPPRPALTEVLKKLIWDLVLTCHCGSSTLTNEDFGPLFSFRQRKLGGPPMPDTVWHFQRFVAQSMSGWSKTQTDIDLRLPPDWICPVPNLEGKHCGWQGNWNIPDNRKIRLRWRAPASCKVVLHLQKGFSSSMSWDLENIGIPACPVQGPLWKKGSM